MNSPPNGENNRYPILSDWSHQEEFWNGKISLRLSQDSDWDISDKQEDKNASYWNDNLNRQTTEQNLDFRDPLDSH